MAGDTEDRIFIGRSVPAKGDKAADQYLTLRFGNRHGLVTGATGTGKTVSLQVLAEGFSRAGTAVFAADIKGDLSGIAAQGEPKDFLVERATAVGLDNGYQPDEFPVTFWDLFGEQGHPIRATISEVGPLLLARLMDLNDTQEGVLNIAFKVADDDGLLLLDLKDLRALLGHIAERAGELTTEYGNVTKQSIGAIQRQLLVLENQGGAKFFGEPALNIKDLIRKDRDGRGMINLLAADRLMNSPRLYATFLLWLLSELFEELPEVGDLDAPKLVFFFDEAHLLFDDAPKALLDKIEQVVRLIRSKGVGVYFVTQNPLDVPESVLAQLGNRVQHALRAFTPREQKAVRTAAETFRPNPRLDTAQVIMEMGKGEALVSMLEGNGVPSMVQRTLVRPPAGRIGPITPQQRAAILGRSPLSGKYDTAIESESAYEVLKERAGERATERNGGPAGAPSGPWGRQPAPQQPAEAPPAGGGGLGGILDSIFGSGTPGPRGGRPSGRASVTEVVAKQVARSVASQVGTQLGKAILRGVLGGMRR
ncbi:helicase HerA-like domain-containing protein [Blastochloris sulfoviridis]|uniref:DUF853 family protein n=1 Tax=Blastochloris sulfoviridis TaxID=50712 RepID=A0A5M6I225_9HYPH|nr:helicase HerA-like domain-containing protein [Blastochloris sulfoviridis]KAA5601875.1 DUF853 family protein [Blastochloris sulfoviridis]